MNFFFYNYSIGRFHKYTNMKQHLFTFFFSLTVLNTYGYVLRVITNSLLRNVFKIQNKDAFQKHKIDYNIPKLKDCKYFDPIIFKNTPEYYKKDFHAYTGGNLTPLHAKEVTAASYAVMSNHARNKSGYATSDDIRTRFSYNAKAYFEYKRPIGKSPIKIIDNGCGIGLSTKYAESMYENTEVTGVDLSPYFLEVGDHSKFKPTTIFYHGLAEYSGEDDNSQDMVMCSYLHHELPYEASKDIIKEAFRILDYGGVLCILDMDPEIKGSNPLLEFIFRRTEPYLNDYKEFMIEIEELAKDIGFEDVQYDYMPKTRMVFLRKPLKN